MQKSFRRTGLIAPFLLVAMFVAFFALASQTSFAQSDADGDGFPDASDSCPGRGNEGGLGVDENGCPYYDADWDGVYDRNDACPGQANEYGFGIGSDGCPLTTPPADNNPDNPPTNDDNPNNPPPETTGEAEVTGEPSATEDPWSTEEPDYGDRDWVRDADGDGFPDSEDACPWQGNEGGLGVDETGCPYYDGDWDGFYDRDDSCPSRADEYGYGIDDVGCPCEDEGCGDDDGDGVPNDEDLCEGFDDNIDVDGDGIPDDCDDEIVIDSDGDGWADEDDCAPDDPAINPDAEEIPDNDVDENCDGLLIQIGSGDIQFTLKWQNLTDYDLHVIDPDGVHIYYGNRTPANSDGELDIDAYPACGNNVDPGNPAVENIFWPDGLAPDGTYQVYVVLYTECGQGQGEWELTIRVGNEVVQVETGVGNSATFSIDLPYEIVVPNP